MTMITASMNHFRLVMMAYAMFLHSIGFAVASRGDNKKMTFEGAAEFYWELFIQPLQR